MQFKTRELLLWIHLHSFDAIAIFDISYGKYHNRICYQRSRSKDQSSTMYTGRERKVREGGG